VARTLPLSHNFDQGFVSDVSRSELGPSAAFRMRDYIPQLEAPLRKRGGWAYASPDLNGLGGLANSVSSLGYLPFPGDGHVIAISDAGYAYQLKQFDGGGGTQISDTGDKTIVPTWPVFWHKTGAKAYGIALGGLNQTGKVPKKYYDTGGGVYKLAPLGGTPPQARAGFSWEDYLVLFNYYDPTDSGNLKNFRVAFSAVGDPDTFTLSGVNAGTFDFPEEMVAGVPVRNTILMWGYNNCWLFNGDTPPPGGNMERKILFAGQGTFDGRSVASWRDYAIWANASGVYSSDGATLTDLTSDGGISTYYRQLVTGFSFHQGWSAAGSIYHDRYVLTIRNGAGVYVTTLVCDLQRKAWTEWTNLHAVIFAHRPAGPGTSLFGGDEELFFAHANLPRVGRLSTLWTPSATYALDGDGLAVLPSLETPFYNMGNEAIKRIRNIYVTYDIRTAGASPTLQVAYTLDPTVGSAYTVSDHQLPTTVTQRRSPVGVRKPALGVGFKIDQLIPSADTRIYAIEAEGHGEEPNRGR
jgi:hypothetical protein